MHVSFVYEQYLDCPGPFWEVPLFPYILENALKLLTIHTKTGDK